MDCFITGTDTGVGKTHVTCALLHELAAAGLRGAAMKPLASGLIEHAGRRVNEDVEALRQAANATLPPQVLNRYSFQAPTAPHFAARAEGRIIEPETVLDGLHAARKLTDVVLVEGVGGWCMPLDESTLLGEVVREAGLPVILVVGIRLGALNHALLTARAIEADGCSLRGWIANQIDPAYDFSLATVQDLQARLPAPLLGTVGWAGRERWDFADDLSAAVRLLAESRGISSGNDHGRDTSDY